MIRIKYSIPAGLVLLALLAACTAQQQSREVPDGKSETTPSVVVVLCDVSNSVTVKGSKAQNLDQVIAEAQKLLSCFPAKSKIVYLPINENVLSKPLVEFAMTAYNDATKKKMKAKIASTGDLLRFKLDSLSKVAGHNTCILTSIENGYELLLSESQHSAYKNHHYKLIILSDMLEACSSSRAGSVRIRHDDTTSMNAAASLFGQFQPEVTFNSLDVDVVVYTPSALTPLVKSRLQNTWRTAFARMKYSKASEIKFIQRVPFSTRPGL